MLKGRTEWPRTLEVAGTWSSRQCSSECLSIGALGPTNAMSTRGECPSRLHCPAACRPHGEIPVIPTSTGGLLPPRQKIFPASGIASHADGRQPGQQGRLPALPAECVAAMPPAGSDPPDGGGECRIWAGHQPASCSRKVQYFLPGVSAALAPHACSASITIVCGAWPETRSGGALTRAGPWACPTGWGAGAHESARRERQPR